MSEMRDSAGTGAPSLETAAYGSAPWFDPNTTNGSFRRLGGARRHRPVGGHVKRAFDVVLALVTLMLLAPMFVLVAALLRVCLGRPVVVSERYVGFAGQVFTAYTFRTHRCIPQAGWRSTRP